MSIEFETAKGIENAPFAKKIRQEFSDDFDAVEFKKIGRDYSYDYFNKYGVPIKKGVNDILNYLKSNGFKIALASSTSSVSVFHHLDDAKIKDYFDVVVCGDMVQKSKPEPDIYLKAAELLNLPAYECYAVEDSRNGLLSAHNAGCRVIMVPDLWQGEEETDAFLAAKCSDLNEVIDFIENENK